MKTSLEPLYTSTTIPNLVSELFAVPYFTKLPLVFTAAISPFAKPVLSVCENLTLSSLSFKLNLEIIF